MLNNIKAVLFDLDGTLVDSMSMWKDIDVDYLERYHIPVPERLQEDIEGLSMYQTAVYFKEHFGIPESIDEIQRTWNDMAYDAYVHKVPLKKGVCPFLDHLKAHGILCGIATSNSRVLTEAILDAHTIRTFFKVLVTGDEVIKGKPDPEVYLTAAKMLNIDPSNCLVFEDIPFGIQAGKNAGMHVCAVEDAYSEKDKDEKIRLADYYIRNFEELL